MSNQIHQTLTLFDPQDYNDPFLTAHMIAGQHWVWECNCEEEVIGEYSDYGSCVVCGTLVNWFDNRSFLLLGQYCYGPDCFPDTWTDHPQTKFNIKD